MFKAIYNEKYVSSYYYTHNYYTANAKRRYIYNNIDKENYKYIYIMMSKTKNILININKRLIHGY